MELTPIIGLVASGASAVYMKKSSDAQRKQLKMERAATQKEYDLNVAQKKLTLEEEQRKNRNLLQKQQATYKARLGAGGMSSLSGTGRAVLDSMQKEHDIENKYLVDQSNISLEALLNGINARNARNLLSASSLENRLAVNSVNALNNFTSTAGRSILK